MQINISRSTLCFIKILLVEERILFGRYTVSRAWKNVPREDSIHESGHVNITLPSSECCGRWKFTFPGYRVLGPGPNFTNVNSSVGSAKKNTFLGASSFSFSLLIAPVWFGLMSYKLSRNCFANSIEILLVSCEFKKLSLVSYKSKLPLQYYQRCEWGKLGHIIFDFIKFYCKRMLKLLYE